MRKILILVNLVLLSNLFISCEDYLSEVPDNRTQIDSKEKISELLVAAYPRQNYMAFTEPMTDNADDKGRRTSGSTQNTYLASYRWEVPVNDNQDTPIGFWNTSYGAIAQANQALASIDELQGQIEEDLSEQRGEALLCRAYNHFILVNLWGEHYNPNTANTDLGVPYVTEPETEVIKEYSRNTVQEVYDLIEEDLLEGLDLIGNNYDQPTFHFTREAALAFATRFYLYKGEWKEVIDYSSELLTNPSQNLRDWVNLSNTLQINELVAQIGSDSENANILLDLTVSDWSYQSSMTRFGMSADKRDEMRNLSNPYNKRWAYPVVQYSSDGLSLMFAKFDNLFEYTDISANIGYPRTMHMIFTYDEVLLARAEAYAMNNLFEESVNDLNIFLPKKTADYTPSDNLTVSEFQNMYPNASSEYSPYYELNEQQAAFVKGIAEIRRREFYGEGLRWFDIKRFHLNVQHNYVGGNNLELLPHDPRRLLQIPPTAVSFGLQNNPR